MDELVIRYQRQQWKVQGFEVVPYNEIDDKWFIQTFGTDVENEPWEYMVELWNRGGE